MTKKLMKEHPTTVVRLNIFNGIRARSPKRYSQYINAGKVVANYNHSSTSTSINHRFREKRAHHVETCDNGLVVPGVLVPAPLKSQKE